MKKELLNTKFIKARKENDLIAKNLFSTLKGEFENQFKLGKESEDSILEKLSKKMTENAKLVNTEDSKKEIELLKEFLPLELNDVEIQKILNEVITTSNGNKNIGMLLGTFMKLSKSTGKTVDANRVKEMLNVLVK